VNGSDLGKPTANWVFVGWIGSGFDADQFCEAVMAQAKPDTLLTQVYVRRRSSDLARYGFHFNDENADGTGIANPRWEIKYDRSFTVQFTSGVSSTNWTPLATVAGDGAEKAFVVTNDPPQRFYRVQRN